MLCTHVGHSFDLCQSAFEPLLFCAYSSFQDILLETNGRGSCAAVQEQRKRREGWGIGERDKDYVRNRLCGVCGAGDNWVGGGRDRRVYEGGEMGQSVDHGDFQTAFP